jgi:hypothetical protein
MKKTLTINISGILFHIEEDAYDSLSKYLSDIKGCFNNTEGGNEILGDIEARIAELLNETINSSKQEIVLKKRWVGRKTLARMKQIIAARATPRETMQKKKLSAGCTGIPMTKLSAGFAQGWPHTLILIRYGCAWQCFS